jgi:hypothetical protein
MCSILATSRGSAASEDEVDTMIRYSRARYFSKEKMLSPVTALSRPPSTIRTNRRQVM